MFSKNALRFRKQRPALAFAAFLAGIASPALAQFSGGSGGAGIINAGTAGQVAYYAATGSTVSGQSVLTISGTAVDIGSTVIDSAGTGNTIVGGIRSAATNPDVSFGWSLGQIKVRAAGQFGFASGTDATQQADTTMCRQAAGIIEFGNTGAACNASGGIQAATLALGGASIGSNALAVTGQIAGSTFVVAGGGLGVPTSFGGTTYTYAMGIIGSAPGYITSPSNGGLAFSSATSYANASTLDTIMTRTAAGGFSIATYPANATALTISGGSITGSSTVTPGISITGTLNTAGVVDGAAVFANITDTACASSTTCFLVDFQVGGTSRFKVDLSGNAYPLGALLGPNGSLSAPTYSFSGETNTGWYLNGSHEPGLSINGTQVVDISQPSAVVFALPSAGCFAFNLNADTFLCRQAAATLHLGHADAASPVAQTLGVQGVATGNLNVAGATFTIAGSQSTGNQSGGAIAFQVSPSGTSGSTPNTLVNAMTINGSKNITFSGNQAINTAANNGSNGFIADTAQGFLWSSRAALLSPADGIVEMTNNAQTGFTRLELGGTTSSFPAIKVNGAALNFRLADDSADANITAAQGTFSANVQSTNHTLTAAAPTVAAAQVGLGGTTVANTNCGTLAGSAGCLVINVAGTTRNVPFY